MGQDREGAEKGLVVDLSTKKLVISAMQILIRRLLIFFVLAVYTVIPFSDSIACDECISRVPFQEGREISYKNLSQVDISTSINAADTHDRPSLESDGKSLCSICFNSVEGIEPYNHTALFSVSQTVNRTALATFSKPASSINKPPQN